MAAKEATVFIFDVGRTMSERSHGRQSSNLDWAAEYLWDKLCSMIATGRKTVNASVVALRSSTTDNELSDDPHYQNIRVLQPLKQYLLDDLRYTKDQLQAGNEDSGDIVSALVVAIQLITALCKKLQYIRRIVLLTDARAPMLTDDLSHITAKLKEDQIQLIVLGVDFDDAVFGYKEEAKDSLKAENEAILKQLCEDCDGVFGTLAQAIDELEIPSIKKVKPVASYKGTLRLGNTEEYDDAFSISVERYPRTMIATTQSASSFVVKANFDSTQTGDNNDDGQKELTTTKNARTYQVDDQDAPGGKREVDAEDLAKGYEYGRTAVYISESDRNVTTFESMQALDIIGFVSATTYEHFFDMSRSNIILPSPYDQKASMAFSSIVHALYELESYAVARLVPKDNKQPLIVLLMPSIEPDMECLYEIELPYAEDLRQYRFPPLDRVLTVSGKSVPQHRNLPSSELQDAMSRYVDSMDLSVAGMDDEGQPTEYLALDAAYSPVLHHVNKSIQRRAIDPHSALAAPSTMLTQYSEPPHALIELAQNTLNDVIKAGDVKKVPPKVLGKRYGRKDERPLSELDINKLLEARPKNAQISRNNTIPDFKQITNSAPQDHIQNACKQLGDIVKEWIEHSVGDSAYDKAIEAMTVMRSEMVELEMADTFNSLVTDLKDCLQGQKLGGDRMDMWYRIRVEKLGLITKDEDAHSKVTRDDAAAFLSSRSSI